MTEPQIARRCPACGASIRQAAFFCPQCGEEIAKANADAADAHTSVVTAPLDGSPVNDPPRVNEPAVEASSEPVEKKAKAIGSPPQKIPMVAPDSGKARRPRPTAPARAAEGDVVHRVQKLRKISTVVLDEAAYDASLRFVLIAAALFVVFLVIALLNKFIR